MIQCTAATAAIAEVEIRPMNQVSVRLQDGLDAGIQEEGCGKRQDLAQVYPQLPIRSDPCGRQAGRHDGDRSRIRNITIDEVLGMGNHRAQFKLAR